MLREIEEIDLLRLVEGDCSPEEAAAVQAWIGAHPRRTQLLAELRAVWRLTGSTTRSWVVADARLRLLRAAITRRSGRIGLPRAAPGEAGSRDDGCGACEHPRRARGTNLTTKRAARFRHL